MSAFEVFKDDENVGSLNAGVLRPNKLKEAKVNLVPRAALGEINKNKVLEHFPQGSKLDCKNPIYKEKDVSDALKEVKLDSKEDVNLKESQPKERVPLVKTPVLDSSDSDFSISQQTAEKFAKGKTKVYVESLFDCVGYRDDIYKYLRELEMKMRPKPHYMKKQPDITYGMRSVLVDWLIEVAEEYKLHGETLFMAVSHVDRFLSTMAVVRSKLQLLGTSALFVAAKYEEIYPPEVNEFAYITDDTYTKKQILRMEQLILKTLSFDISSPSHHTFIIHLTKVVDISEKETQLALYICELTLVEGDHYLNFTPSLIACAAIALARHCLGKVDVWPTELSKASGYTLQRHLADVLPFLNETHSKAPTIPQSAAREKYRNNKLLGVSCIPHRPLVVRNPESS